MASNISSSILFEILRNLIHFIIILLVVSIVLYSNTEQRYSFYPLYRIDRIVAKFAIDTMDSIDRLYDYIVGSLLIIRLHSRINLLIKLLFDI